MGDANILAAVHSDARQNQSFEMKPTPPPVIAEGLYSFQIGGSERIGAELAIGYARRGYRVLCFAFYDSDGPMRELLVNAGVECPDLNYLSRTRGIRRLTYQVAFAKFLRRENVRALHVQHATSLILSAIPARLCGVSRVVMTEHSIHQFRDDPRYRKAARRYCRLADSVTVVHPSLLQYFRGEIAVPESKLHYVPNGVSIPGEVARQNRLRTALGVPDSAFLFLYAGRLHELKDLGTLLDAVNLLAPEVRARVRVWLAGDGDQRKLLETKQRDLKLEETISFLGARNDVHELLKEADGFVMTSVSEGLPMALIEAMAARVPCVATAVGGIPELFEGNAGLLAPARDPAAIAAQMTELVLRADLRTMLVANALEKMRRTNDIEAVITRYLALLGLPAYWNGKAGGRE